MKDRNYPETIDKLSPEFVVLGDFTAIHYASILLNQGHFLMNSNISFSPRSKTMEQFPLVDIVIGLSLIYTFLSLLSSELTQFVATLLHWRTKNLKRGIMTLLGELLKEENSTYFKGTITDRLYRDPRMSEIVQSFDQRHLSMTTYKISARLFAETLLDVLQELPDALSFSGQQTAAEITVAKLLLIVETSPEVSAQLKANLKRLIDRIQRVEPDPKQQMTRLIDEIALWFNQAMEGAFMAYRHRLRTGSFLISLVVAIAINADSLYIIRRISENTATRTIVVQNATKVQGCRENLNSQRCVERMTTLMESTTVPIAWHRVNRQKQFPDLSRSTILRAIGGWLLTAIAISMGSRFWFEILNRIINFHGGETQSRSATRSGKYKSSYSTLR